MAMRRVVHSTAAVAAAALIAAGPAAGEVTSSLTAGMNEGTFIETIAGERQPPETDHQCFTQTDLDHLETWLATGLGDDCSAADLKTSDHVTTFEIACAGDGDQVLTRAELTTGADSFETVIDL